MLYILTNGSEVLVYTNYTAARIAFDYYETFNKGAWRLTVERA